MRERTVCGSPAAPPADITSPLRFTTAEKCPSPLSPGPPPAGKRGKCPSFPLDFVSCLDCSHVFNAAFTYDAVPYASKPNLMYNRGAIWSDFLKELREEVLAFLPQQPTVVEIGHGDGHFLGGLAESRPEGRYIGFDPHGARTMPYGSVDLRSEFFNPLVDIPRLRPDLIVSRHVLEHLMNPLELLQAINIAAAWTGKPIQLLFEVPCIDRALEYGRTNDFYFEHYSQFTTKSFHQMMIRAQFEVKTIGHAYNGEIVYALVNTSTRIDHLLRLQSSLGFRATARRSARQTRPAISGAPRQRQEDRHLGWGRQMFGFPE